MNVKKTHGIRFSLLMSCLTLSLLGFSQVYESQFTPVAYYPCDSVDGLTVKDASANGLDGTIIGKVTFADDSPSGIGQCLSFTGNGDKGQPLSDVGVVNLGDPAKLKFVGQMSISFWVKFEKYFNDYYIASIISKGHVVDVGEINIRVVRDVTYPGVEFSMYPGAGGSALTEEGAIADSTWAHVVVLSKLGYKTIYINGEFVARSTEVNPNKGAVDFDSPWAFGGRGGGDDGQNYETIDRTYYGLLDEVRFYDEAITSDEVTYLYNLGLSSTPSGLIANDVSKDLKIFPSVVENGMITVQLSQPTKGTINIFSTSGQQVMTSSINGESETLNVSQLTKGFYVANIQTANGLISSKFIIK